MTQNYSSQEFIQIISTLNKITNSIGDMSEFYHALTEQIPLIFHTENWSLLRLDDLCNKLFFSIVEGVDSSSIKHIPIEVGSGIAGRVAQTGCFEVIANSQSEIAREMDDKTNFSTKNVVAVPVTFKHKTIGVLELINVPDISIFTEGGGYLELLHYVADFIGATLIAYSQLENMKSISQTDTLTGTYNRRKFDNIVAHYSINDDRRCSIHKSKDLLAVVMIDINDFKQINDNYGHLVGDRVLRQCAVSLKEHFRDSDVIIRFGGDEFIVLIEDFTEHKDNLLNTVRKTLERVSRELNYHCSFSYGIAAGNKNELMALVQDADSAMYDFKSEHKKKRAAGKH